MAGRRCEREGCRAWARRGGTACVAHAGVARLGESRRAGGGRYEAYAPTAHLGDALGQAPENLQAEIAVTRLLLAELLQSDLPPDKLVGLVDRATAALARLLRANQQIGGSEAGDIDEIVARVLAELGDS